MARHALTQEATYNIKAVTQQTGIPADTVRAWERRYGVPHPARSGSGRRLYSDNDVATLQWLRERTAAGMSISQAVRQLGARDANGSSDRVSHDQRAPETLERLRASLLQALLAFDATAATRIAGEGFALLPVETVCLALFQPVLIEIGARWQRQESTIAQEHFATHFIQQRLSSLFLVYAPVHQRGTVLTACVADELHDLGLQILALILARRGWQVIHLGANLPLVEIMQATARLHPALVCLSATSASAAQNLLATVRALNQLPAPRPVIAYGGAPFSQDDGARAAVEATYLGADAGEAADRVEQLFA